jgi:hypothetical protein
LGRTITKLIELLYARADHLTVNGPAYKRIIARIEASLMKY